LLEQCKTLGFGGQALKRFVGLAVEPGGLDDERIATPPLGQSAAEVAEVGPKVVKLQLPPSSRVPCLEPASDPVGIDRRDGPAAKSVQQPRLQQPIRFRITGLARD
jgi:hypothetical protein